MNSKLFLTWTIGALSLIAIFSALPVLADWTAPQSVPPACDPALDEACNPPINVGLSDQLKVGGLALWKALTVGPAPTLSSGQVPKVWINNTNTSNAYDQGLYVQNAGQGWSVSAKGPFGIRADGTSSALWIQGPATFRLPGYASAQNKLLVATDNAGTLGWIATSSLGLSGGGGTNFWTGSLGGNISNLNTGNVGIGTANPTSRLHVVDNNSTGTGIWQTFENTATTNSYAGLKMIVGGVTRGTVTAGLAAPTFGVVQGLSISAGNASDDIGFKIGPGVFNGTATSPGLVLKGGTGNVGIGTANPSSRLQVNGSFALTNGSQGQGKILQSNASGVATWVATSTLGLGGGGGTYNADGTTINLSGTTFSVNTTNIQRRITGTCAVGSSVRAVNADGTVVCEAGITPTGVYGYALFTRTCYSTARGCNYDCRNVKAPASCRFLNGVHNPPTIACSTGYTSIKTGESDLPYSVIPANNVSSYFSGYFSCVKD